MFKETIMDKGKLILIC